METAEFAGGCCWKLVTGQHIRTAVAMNNGVNRRFCLTNLKFTCLASRENCSTVSLHWETKHATPIAFGVRQLAAALVPKR